MSINAVSAIQNSNVKPSKISFSSNSQRIEEKKNGTTLLLGSLTALAIGAGIYFATRGKSATSKTTSSSSISEASPVKSVEERIAELKEKIRNKYVQEKRDYFGNSDKLGGAPLVFTNDLSIFNYACSIKEADAVLISLINDIDTANAKKVLAEFSKSARKKLAELSKDTDWVEMRKLRKELIKLSLNDLGVDANGQKLYLVNEILFAKVNGKSKFFEAVGLTVDGAVKMVKDAKFSTDDFNALIPKEVSERHNVLQSLVMHDGSQWYEPLTKHHFGNFKNIDYANFTVRNNQRQINHAIEWKEKFPERLKQSGIAEKMRKSDEVKELKELVAQLQN